MDDNIAIKVEHLTKKFGNFTAVDDVSFSVNKGEIFAFLGPNGAGKTTTIKMLTTLLSPTNGTILLDSINISTDKNTARKSFGIVFQDPSLDDELTALENMTFHAVLYNTSKKNLKDKIKSLLSFVELWDRRNSLVKTFSGGMKRRLEIARGLLHNPKIIFLDEPTVGLDPQTRNKIWEYVKNLSVKENITIFFTTHYMEEAQNIAKRIAIMDHGKIIAQGSSKELEQKTNTTSLEKAFLALTGSAIREEEGSSKDKFRAMAKAFGRH